MKLYGYWRSSAAFRIRIALNLKRLDYEDVPVNLVQGGGQQFSKGYLAMNPQARVPTFVEGDLNLGQSMAIVEYLEEKYPQPPLLPATVEDRAVARQIAQIIACDVHPLNNVRVLRYLEEKLGADEQSRNAWYSCWVHDGLRAIEAILQGRASHGPFCMGERVSVADVFLIPQLYNAHRFNVPVDDCPRLLAIEGVCLDLPAFQRALPEHQPDASR